MQRSAIYATMLYNAGRASTYHGDTEPALGYFERALAIRRALLPPDHPDIGASLTSLAWITEHLGKEGGAEFALAALAVNRRSQTLCANSGCVRRVREDGAPLDVCVKCRRTFYCGKACQTADCKAGHRKECKALVAEGGAGRAEVGSSGID